MVETGAGKNNIFRQVEKIQISDMHHQTHGYFGLLCIVNIGNIVLPNPLVVSDLQNLDNNAQEVQNFYDRVRSYMIANSIEVSITKTYLNKLRLCIGEY